MLDLFGKYISHLKHMGTRDTEGVLCHLMKQQNASVRAAWSNRGLRIASLLQPADPAPRLSTQVLMTRMCLLRMRANGQCVARDWTANKEDRLGRNCLNGKEVSDETASENPCKGVQEMYVADGPTRAEYRALMTRTVIASMPCPTEDINTHPPNCEKLKEETRHDAKLLHRLCSRLYLKRMQEPTPFSPDQKQRRLPAKVAKAAKALRINTYVDLNCTNC